LHLFAQTRVLMKNGPFCPFMTDTFNDAWRVAKNDGSPHPTPTESHHPPHPTDAWIVAHNGEVDHECQDCGEKSAVLIREPESEGGHLSGPWCDSCGSGGEGDGTPVVEQDPLHFPLQGLSSMAKKLFIGAIPAYLEGGGGVGEYVRGTMLDIIQGGGGSIHESNPLVSNPSLNDPEVLNRIIEEGREAALNHIWELDSL